MFVYCALMRVYVCVHVYVHECVCESVSACDCVQIHVFLYMRAYAHLCACAGVYMCVCVWVYVRLCVCIHTLERFRFHAEALEDSKFSDCIANLVSENSRKGKERKRQRETEMGEKSDARERK